MSTIGANTIHSGCNCIEGTVESANLIDISGVYPCDDSDIPFTYVGQPVLIFYGNDAFSVGAVSELDGEGRKVKTSADLTSIEDVLVCVNNGLYFCCTDDYNSDGIIDYKDSAIFKIWAESSTTDLAELQDDYEAAIKAGGVANDTDSTTPQWPITKPCKLPALPCADFNFDFESGTTDADMHTASTQLYGNVKVGLPKGVNDKDTAFTLTTYYPSLADGGDADTSWSDDEMDLYPSVFDTDILENDIDKPCPSEENFTITTVCNRPESTVCINQYLNDGDDNDNDRDVIVLEVNCIKEDDFNFHFVIDYEGPYIELSKVKYSLTGNSVLKTSFNAKGVPTDTLEDWTIDATYPHNDWDLPGKITYSNGTDYYSSFTASLQVDKCGYWKVKLYSETPDCIAEDTVYELAGLYLDTCITCEDLVICENDYPDYFECANDNDA